MNTKLLALALLFPLAGASGMVAAKGCLKGAAVGGVAGHVAGRHGVLGAAAGCAIGHHQAKVKAKREAASTAAQRNATTANAEPTPREPVLRK